MGVISGGRFDVVIGVLAVVLVIPACAMDGAAARHNRPCAEFDTMVVRFAIDSNGVELGDNRAVSATRISTTRSWPTAAA